MLKKQQEENYQRLLVESSQKQIINVNEKQQKEKIEQSKGNRKQKLEQFFASYRPQSPITLALRLPSGKRLTQDFGRKDPVQLIYDFIEMQEEKGFEDNSNKFEIVSPGFPPRVLNPKVTLESEFGDSDQEALNVREVFP